MKGAPIPKHEVLDQIAATIAVVDRKGRDMDERWGFGRLPTLVPIETALAFRRQRLKFSRATLDYDAEAVKRHGEAMVRAYDKLNDVAMQAGARFSEPDQWEFDTPAGLVVLVKDIADVTQDRLQGRAGQVWSLDELASVLRAYPALTSVKEAFPGAVVETVRPAREDVEAAGQALREVPY